MDPISFLILIAKFLVLTFIAEKLGPKANPGKAASGGLKDISFPTADATRPHQWLIGRQIIDNANLFCTYDFKANERFRRVRSGLFSHTNVPLPTEYYISAGMILCGGTGVTLKEIWVEDVKIWEGSIADGGQVELNYSLAEVGSEDSPAGFRGILEFHSGSTTPSAYLESKRGVGNTPAWSHLTYVVLRGATVAEVTDPIYLLTHPGAYVASIQPGAWVGTSTTVKHLKFVCERFPLAPPNFSGPVQDVTVVNGDANLAFAAFEILTDRHYGAGFPAELLGGIETSAATLYAENHGTSQIWDSQRATGEVLMELCRQAGAVLQPDPEYGGQILKLLRATDDIVFTFDDSNIKEIAEFGRAGMDGVVNTMAVTYTASAEKWVSKPVEVQDLAAIEVAGQVIPGTANYSGITNEHLASVIAMRDLRAVSSPLATARLSAIVAQKQSFVPGQAVILASPNNKIQSIRMRITSARYSKPGEALCELEMIEDVFTSGSAVYGVTEPVAGTPGTVLSAPGAVGWDSFEYVARPGMGGTAGEVHMLYFAGAPAANPERATGYKLAYFDDNATRNSSTAAWDQTTFKFASRGALTSVALAAGTTGTFTMSVTASDAYTISQNLGTQCVAICGQEFVLATATVDGLEATVTVFARGQCGTASTAAFPLAGQVSLLYGYAVDPKILATETATAGTPDLKAAVSSYVRAQTLGPGGNGPFDGLDAASDTRIAVGQQPFRAP